MKQFIFIFFIISFEVLSQDTIIFRSGDLKAVKLDEVGVKEIKYHSFTNTDGPIYTISKSDVRKIKYKGGTVDSFAVIPLIANEKILVTNNSVSEPSLSLYKKNTFVYKGRHLNALEADELFNAYWNPEIRHRLLGMNEEINEDKRKAGLAVGLGLGLGFAIPVVFTFYGLSSMISSSGSDNGVSIIVAGAIIGAAVRISGAVSQKVNKNKAFHTREKMVKLYNSGLK